MRLIHFIRVAVALFFLTHSVVWAGGSKPSFSLKFFLQAGPGTNATQIVNLALTNPDQIISVNKFAILTEKHVQSLMKLPDGGALVTLTATGARILEAETSNRTGSIMVVMCNGRLIYAPEIDAPLRGGKVILPLGLMETDYAMFQKFAQKEAKP
jgi:hypothetical protein